MHFAICDTGKQSLAWLERDLPALLQQRKLTAHIVRYDSINAMLAAHSDHPFALAFLPQTDLASAAALRADETDCELIFVGAKCSLTAQAIEYRPIAYIDVPASEASLSHALDQFMFYTQHGDRAYPVQTRHCTGCIPHSDILYFHSVGHQVFIHTSGGGQPIVHTRKLDDVEKQLSLQGYLRCHQRYLVRLSAVCSLEHQTMKLILSDGCEIPVSKRHFNHVVNTIVAQNHA